MRYDDGRSGVFIGLPMGPLKKYVIKILLGFVPSLPHFTMCHKTGLSRLLKILRYPFKKLTKISGIFCCSPKFFSKFFIR